MPPEAVVDASANSPRPIVVHTRSGEDRPPLYEKMAALGMHKTRYGREFWKPTRIWKAATKKCFLALASALQGEIDFLLLELH